MLAGFVVLQGEGDEEAVGVVGGGLHRDDTGGVLGGDGVEKDAVDLEPQDFREQGFRQGGGAWLVEVGTGDGIGRYR